MIYYDVCSGEPYEDTYHMFRTTNKKWAEWYCDQCNMCTDNWQTYYVLEHRPLNIVKPFYELVFGFAFLPFPELVLEASEVDPYPDEDIGYTEELGLILVNGSGTSYDECLENATNHAKVIRRSIK